MRVINPLFTSQSFKLFILSETLLQDVLEFSFDDIAIISAHRRYIHA